MHRSSRRVTFALALLALSLTGSTALAQFHDAAALGRRLSQAASDHPRRISVRSLARTREGRDVWLVTIGAASADARPAVLVVGGLDGSSLAGSELALRFVELMAADASDSTRALLESTTFYVIPRASPDAAEAFFARPREPRDGNATPYDSDRDGAVDEDGFEDLDGDGIITQMRVQSPRGRYLAHPRDERVMIAADASRGERGTYELLSEGRDNDKDGSFNEDPVGGVDINRNFTFAYRAFGPLAGVHAMSETESRAIADFCYDHQNIAAVFSFSPQANLLHPWEARASEAGTGPARRIVRSVREGDVEYLNRLAKIYGETTGLKGGPAYEKGEGSFAEWAYYHYGRFSVSTPGWLVTASKGARDTTSSKSDSAKLDDERAAIADTLAWFERNGVTGTHVPWKRVEHADFPGQIVEVGGAAPYVTSEPPAAMLDSLARRHATFIVRLGGLLPRIEVADVRTESLGDGLTRVRALIANNGYLPTLAAMGDVSRVPIDVKVEVKLGSGQSVVSGRRVQLLGAVPGSRGSRELTWVIAGTGNMALSVSGPMAGSAERTVRLGR